MGQEFGKGSNGQFFFSTLCGWESHSGIYLVTGVVGGSKMTSLTCQSLGSDIWKALKGSGRFLKDGSFSLSWHSKDLSA